MKSNPNAQACPRLRQDIDVLHWSKALDTKAPV